MDNLLQDLRYAFRALRRSPGFTAVAALTLALGIGANTAIFGVIDGILIRPLPYEAPERVVRLVPYHRERGEGDLTFSYPDLLDLRGEEGTFDGIAAQDGWSPTLVGEEGAERIAGASVSANYFRVLGVRPALGRFFLPEEDAPGSSQAVVISHGLWVRRFGADPGVVGRPVQLGGATYTIAGVVPADFEDPRLSRGGGEEPQIWRATPGYWVQEDRAERETRFLTAVARLRPGVTLEESRATMSTVMRRLEAAYPEADAGWGVRVVPLKEQIVGPVRPALLALFGAVGLVLLIACANLANLLLARAAGRRREIAVRLAVGASRGRILRQLLVESVVLASIGGALGLLLASLATDGIVGLGAGRLPRLATIELDGRVLAFAAALSIATGLLFGLAPALRASRADVQAALKEGGRAATDGRAQARFRNALVVAEVALTVVLLAGAGLLLRSLWSLYRVDPGLEPQGVLTLSIAPPWGGYDDDAKAHALYDRLLERLAALPGVDAAGATNILPFSGGYWRTGFLREGEAMPEKREEMPSAEIRTASPDLFRALRTPILRGRGVEPRDRAGAPPVVVINRALAERYFPGQDPLGRRLLFPDGPREVVGVVADVRQFALDVPAEPVLYLPHAQAPSWLMLGSHLVLRATGDPLALAPAVRAVVRETDARIPISRLRTMEAALAGTTAAPRFRTVLLALFATLAFALAAIGVYGVISYGVAQRTHEIGVRVALGARERTVLGMVVREGMKIVAIGIGLGTLAALALTRLISGMLYEVSPADPATFAAAPALLAAAALLASWIPARRAARVDPMEALRNE